MRSMWKGHVRISLVTFPIRIYKATDESETVSFHQLHKGECSGRVGYDKRCKKCNKSLTGDEIVKGYEIEKETYVSVSDEDLAKIKLESTKIVDAHAFVEPDEIHRMLYEEPYFLGPDGEVAMTAYALVVETLKHTGKVAIGSIVFRDREETVAVMPERNGLVLYKLRYRSEVRSIAEVPKLDQLKAINPNELTLAQSLVESMVKPFAEIELRNRYNDALRELIEAKRQGKEIVEQPIEVGPPPGDIMALLKASIDEAKGRKKAA